MTNFTRVKSSKILYLYSAIFIAGLLIFTGCFFEKRKKQSPPKKIEESLIDMNKDYVEQEAKLINKYIKRHKWKMTETGTGLRYMIYKKGSGANAKNGDVVALNYIIESMAGDTLYSSDESGVAEFKIGMADVESGLHEGLTYMRVGDRAKFILPAHLAHGLSGDGRRIPRKSPIVYDIELLALK